MAKRFVAVHSNEFKPLMSDAARQWLVVDMHASKLRCILGRYGTKEAAQKHAGRKNRQIFGRSDHLFDPNTHF